jgi:hypothetical protein
MGIMLLLGGSTDMMSAMSTMEWLRRVMIIATLIMVGFTVYRFIKQDRHSRSMLILTAVSTIVSIGFIAYSLIGFGW